MPADLPGKGLRLCVVSSVGGHLDEVMSLLPAFRDADWFLVVNAEGALPGEARDRTLRIVHSERDWKLLVNLWEAYRILRERRPHAILSCGAGPAVPFALVGRLLGAKVVFVESFSAVERPTLTGRILYRLADRFLYQWESLAPFFPKGEFVGTLF